MQTPLNKPTRPDGSALPKPIQRWWYSIEWDVSKVWALDLPVETGPLDPFLWHLDVPIWSDPTGKTYAMSPREVLSGSNPKELARVMAADLSFPIEVLDRGGRLMILDGIHRLAKTVMLGTDTIRFRKVPRNAVLWLGEEFED